MKQTLLLLFIFFSYFSFAQQIKRCSSAEYLKQLEDNDPAFAQRRLHIENDMQQWISSHSTNQQRQIVTVPVVFHLLYNDSSQNLDDSIILSQMEVINEDYRRLNADTGQTPLAFRAVAADCEIEFCLAKRTPDDQPTNGIIHKFTSVTSFTSYDDPKLDSTGGDSAWDATRYLNVWVASFTNPNFLGLGTFPGGDLAHDGVVMNYKACGRIGSHLLTHYDKGRTLTHEIGHWFNLIHPWADDGGGCSVDDLVSDTPLQASETYGCPSYPKTDNCTSSFPGIMFMTYMDYTDDECMNIFTLGQKARMLAALNVDRASILTSNGCLSVGIDEAELKNLVSVYPNPVSTQLAISSRQLAINTMTIYDLLGEKVLAVTPLSLGRGAGGEADVSSLTPGIYFLKLTSDKGNVMIKVVKE